MMSEYAYAPANQFTPNLGRWTSLGDVVSLSQNGNQFTFTMSSGPAPLLTFLSPSIFRFRFNPSSDYARDVSVAVVGGNFGSFEVTMQDAGAKYLLDTGTIRVEITKAPYSLAVYRGGQLLHADTPGYNVVYIPGQQVVANFKLAPSGALYYGFGEKAGSTLAKNNCDMTFFNWDNFIYSSGNVGGEGGGPLNPSEPLYCSVPFLIETNPHPVAGPRYSYGLFLDNPAQTYMNVTANDYASSDMSGKYYIGALYGDLNYYVIYGAEVGPVGGIKRYVRR
jgi:alpha-glucosidase